MTIKNVEYAFRWCPPGTFMMGSSESEEGRTPIERQHQVTLTRGFWMLETEVTQQMWESIMGNNPSEFNGLRLPVEKVSWNDCQEYVTKLNGMKVAPAGFKFSLPTEAQWEYACRAGTTTAFFMGNTLVRANFGGAIGQTREVGSYPANAWGLYDMHGNVREWLLCSMGGYPSGAVTDPTRDSTNERRMVRGGSWLRIHTVSRSAARFHLAPTSNDSDTGTRLSLVYIE